MFVCGIWCMHEDNILVNIGNAQRQVSLLCGYWQQEFCKTCLSVSVAKQTCCQILFAGIDVKFGSDCLPNIFRAPIRTDVRLNLFFFSNL